MPVGCWRLMFCPLGQPGGVLSSEISTVTSVT